MERQDREGKKIMVVRTPGQDRELMGNLVELSGQCVLVGLRSEGYSGVLGLEHDEDFTDLRIAVAVNGDYNRIQRTHLSQILAADPASKYIQLNIETSAGGMGA